MSYQNYELDEDELEEVIQNLSNDEIEEIFEVDPMSYEDGNDMLQDLKDMAYDYEEIMQSLTDKFLEEREDERE